MADLTHVQNERLRSAMREYRDRDCDGSTTELANRLGRSQPSLSTFISGKSGAAFETAQRFARLVGRDVADVLGPQEAQAGEVFTLRERTVEYGKRYDVLDAVRIAARAQGYEETFVGSWDVQLDADEQPDFDLLWTICKADYAKWKRKNVRPVAVADDDLDTRRPDTRRR